jgi:uncharacterized damage-inducible protein DinB
MKTALIEYARYNIWANERLIAALQQLPNELLASPIASSFGGVFETLNHIYGAEVLWAKRLQGDSPKTFPKVEKATDLFIALPAASRDLLKTLQSFTAKELKAEGTYYVFSAQTDFTSPRFEMMWHCVNHSTFHRGQLVMMMRQLGYTEKLPFFDYIFYCRERNIKQ